MSKNKVSKPYFLWDYDLSHEDVVKTLNEGNDIERKWLMGRILEHAQFEDILEYLTPKQIAHHLPGLRLRKATRESWRRALSVWGYDVQAQK